MRVGKSFWYFFGVASLGRYLQTDLCPLMDDRIGQWARMQRVQPNRHRAEGKNAVEN